MWNNQYREAATLYKEFLDQDSKLAETNNYLRYKCTSSGTISTEGAYGNYYQAYFLRYNDANVNANFTSWPNMFSDLMSTKAADAEWIWTITFPSGDEPAYPFVDLFASTSDGGSYQLRPSSACIYNYNRSDLLRTNDAPYDPRREERGQPSTRIMPIVIPSVPSISVCSILPSPTCRKAAGGSIVPQWFCSVLQNV